MYQNISCNYSLELSLKSEALNYQPTGRFVYYSCDWHLTVKTLSGAEMLFKRVHKIFFVSLFFFSQLEENQDSAT